MSPKPLVAPAFLKTQFRETVEHWTKVTRYVARMIFVGFDIKTTKEDASGAQSAAKGSTAFSGSAICSKTSIAVMKSYFPVGSLLSFKSMKVAGMPRAFRRLREKSRRVECQGNPEAVPEKE